jgi:hypothetical protein
MNLQQGATKVDTAVGDTKKVYWNR